MKRNVGFAFCLFLFLCFCRVSFALQVLTPVEGEAAFIQISMKDLNVIKTDIKGLKVFTSSKDLDVKVEGKIVFLKYTGAAPEAQELVLLGSSGSVYTLVLKPAAIPSETIVLNTGEKVKKAASAHINQPYVKAIKELIRGMYTETPPPGYSIETTKEDRTKWNEVSIVLEKRYKNPVVVGEVFSLKAKTDVVLDERELYSQGVLAVSIEKHELKQGEEAKAYVVRKAN
ncbi:MAG: type-F conjugative transfer system secretin TraK [Candidatus Methanosuratincola sp.]